MAPKQQLEKEAWQWAEHIDPEKVTEQHISTVYRLQLKACQFHKCMKNCKGNPHCLLHLGEREWMGHIDDRYWHDVDDPADERRKPGNFVGLKNLGATCYVNTFLQLWFSNQRFRSAILNWWNPNEYQIPQHQPSSLSAPKSPTTICGHLQLIFALLSFSQRRYLDPSPFIECLKLDSTQQQDAQEFSKLFIMLLEDQLASSGLSHLIQGNFMGTYYYVIKCSTCETESRTSSKFYELDLNVKGNKTLAECLDEFLEEEKLEGDNQYMCSVCNQKQNATRAIQLHSLPPVLNMQLLRFVFDRKTGHKKKLNSFIQFPETLDVGPLIGLTEGAMVYRLKAVLIHSGPSAYSGHYTAHIKENNAWYKFNDENVEKMKSKSLELGSEEDFDGKSSEKKPHLSKGYHTSKNAYMLVYSKEEEYANDCAEEIQLTDLPVQLQQLVAHDNDMFEMWLLELSEMKDVNISRGHERIKEVNNVFSILPSSQNGDEYSKSEFIASSWINQFYKSDHSDQVPKVDNSSLICQHNKLDPDQVASVKCISKEGAELIYGKFRGGPRLLVQESLCEDCVVERCRVIRSKARMAEDAKAIKACMKANPIDENGVWIGKVSLRSWRKLATEREERKKGDSNGHSAAENSNGSNSASEEFVFNEDMLCDEHYNLSPDISCRRLIPLEIWNRLKVYFPEAVTHNQDALPCPQCIATKVKDEEAKQYSRRLAITIKSQLSHLYSNKYRPVLSLLTAHCHMISTHFLNAWRAFIRDPIGNSFPETIANSLCLCPHNGFLYFPETFGRNNCFPNITLISRAEWQLLTQFSTPDIEMTIEKTEENGVLSFTIIPDVCQECCLAREKKEFDAQFLYQDATIYVRKKTLKDDVVPSEENSQFLDLTENGEPSDEHLLKRKFDENGAPPEKVIRLDNAASRKSVRHRCARGEKKVQVDCTSSLRDLKLKVMQLFSVPPFDQHLLHNGKELKGDQKTMASLGILPSDVIYLQADEAVEDPTFFEDASKASVPETGFQGTGLISR